MIIFKNKSGIAIAINAKIIDIDELIAPVIVSVIPLNGSYSTATYTIPFVTEFSPPLAPICSIVLGAVLHVTLASTVPLSVFNVTSCPLISTIMNCMFCQWIPLADVSANLTAPVDVVSTILIIPVSKNARSRCVLTGR